jgi:hypothetical protein
VLKFEKKIPAPKGLLYREIIAVSSDFHTTFEKIKCLPEGHLYWWKHVGILINDT